MTHPTDDPLREALDALMDAAASAETLLAHALVDGMIAEEVQDRFDAWRKMLLAAHDKGRAALARPSAPETLAWRGMDSAPKDGKHCILAVKSGAFVYSIEGGFHGGKWLNAAEIDGEPLCWMPKVRIPDKFLPWTDAYKGRVVEGGDDAA